MHKRRARALEQSKHYGAIIHPVCFCFLSFYSSFFLLFPFSSHFCKGLVLVWRKATSPKFKAYEAEGKKFWTEDSSKNGMPYSNFVLFPLKLLLFLLRSKLEREKCVGRQEMSDGGEKLWLIWRHLLSRSPNPQSHLVVASITRQRRKISAKRGANVYTSELSFRLFKVDLLSLVKHT